MRLQVFLDTSVLLKGFSAFRGGHAIPAYMTDDSANRYTFEKCVLEAYMAFRGVGGKKPDEGRGNWAEKNLRKTDDPSPLGKLSSMVHDGDTAEALFWVNHILEAGHDVEEFRQMALQYIETAEYPKVETEAEALRRLATERARFEDLCNKFHDFLEEFAVKKIAYCDVFSINQKRLPFMNNPDVDGFARDTIIPSEDFEIVYAAMTIPADMIVTDDDRLIRCSKSLGLNLPISVQGFCKGMDYKAKANELGQF